MRLIFKRYRTLAGAAETDALEVLAGLVGVLVGIWLALPPLNSFGTSAAWEVVREYTREDAVGTAVTLLGFAQLFVYGRNHHSARLGLALAATLWWETLALLFLLGSPGSTGVPVYTVIALSQLWVTLRLAGMGVDDT